MARLVAPKVLVQASNVINLAALGVFHSDLAAAINADDPAQSSTEVPSPVRCFKIKLNLSVQNTESSTAGQGEPIAMGIYKKEYSMLNTESILNWLTDQQFRRQCIWFTRGLFGVDSTPYRSLRTIKIPKRLQTLNEGDKYIFAYATGGGTSSVCLTSVVNAYK